MWRSKGLVGRCSIFYCWIDENDLTFDRRTTGTVDAAVRPGKTSVISWATMSRVPISRFECCIDNEGDLTKHPQAADRLDGLIESGGKSSFSMAAEVQAGKAGWRS